MFKKRAKWLLLVGIVVLLCSCGVAQGGGSSSSEGAGSPTDADEPNFPETILGPGSLPIDSESWQEWDGSSITQTLPSGTQFVIKLNPSKDKVIARLSQGYGDEWDDEPQEYPLRDMMALPMVTDMSTDESDQHYLICGPLVIFRSEDQVYVSQQYSDMCIEVFELQLPPPEWQKPEPPLEYYEA